MSEAAPRHILLTVNTSWNVVNFRSGLIAALQAEGHTITVLAPPDARSPEIEQMGCRYVPLTMDNKGLAPHKDLALLLRFIRHFRRERPDAVLSFTIKNNVYGALAARMLRIPFLPNVTGLGTAFLSGRWLTVIAGQLIRGAFRRLPVVFFQNPDDRDEYLKHGLVEPSQCELLPGSGVDLNRFKPAPYPTDRDKTVFLLIARLLRDKGVVEFAEAARAIRAERSDVEFRLLGPLGAENRTAIPESTVRTWVEEGTVTYLGTTDDVRPEIAAAHCVVLPSYREGTPRTLLEAAAMGRPVITTDAPGCRQVVDHEVNGFLCAPQNAESLLDQFRTFLEMPGRAQSMLGQAGRQKVEDEFDHALVVQKYRSALHSLQIRKQAGHLLTRTVSP